MMKNKTGFKVYGVHISQRNRISAITSPEFIELLKLHGAVYVIAGKEPHKYLASFILPTRERQTDFMVALNERKIGAVADIEPSFAKREYLQECFANKFMAEIWKEAEIG